MRLIDADDAVKRLREAAEQMKVVTAAGCKAVDIYAIPQFLEMLPTIDAVPVVRCGECKYWLCVEDGFGDCTNRRFHLDGCADPSMKMDDFCSYGERRSDD